MQSTKQDARKIELYTVLGAKDGIGVSTFAVNAAFLASKMREGNVLLVDFDLNCQGDLASMMKGAEWKKMLDVKKLMDKNVPPSMLTGYLTNHEKRISYLRAFSSGNEDLESLTVDNIAMLFDYLSKAFDTIIVDCGSVLTSLHAPAFIGSGKIIIITLGILNCLNHASKKYEMLLQNYIPSEKIHFLINQWPENSKIPKSLVANKLPKQTTYFLNQDRANMEKAYEKAVPLFTYSSKCPYVKSMEGCFNDGLLTCVKREYPLTEIMKSDSGNFTEKWIVPLGSRVAAQKDVGSESPETDNNQVVIDQSFSEEDENWINIKQEILNKLFQSIDLKQPDMLTNKDQQSKLVSRTTESILKIINEIGEDKVPQGKRKQLVAEVLNEALGLGPLEILMDDKSISEIMINGKDQIYIERGGKLVLSNMRFTSDKQLFRIIERIVSPIGRRVDESTPLVDARLADGSRVNIIIPPLALKGATVTIRRFSEKPLQVSDLINYGTLSKEMSEFVRACIKAKLNIIISGGTGSGKTTLLNVLSSFIPEGDRIVTIEDAAELKLNQPHVVTLESRPPNLEGEGAVTIRDLVKNSLRMRPDRIVVGECRGGEALDMLQAMNTGHDGSMTTVHANSAKDAISRLETLVLFSSIELPSKAIREQIASGINLIIQLNRFSDGSRKISDISEVTGMEGNVVTLQSIFTFVQEGVDNNRKVIGRYQPSGVIPKFYDEMQQKGIRLSRDIFVSDGNDNGKFAE